MLVAEGVGTGIIFDGQVYRGQRGAAGEFGHMVIGRKRTGALLMWESRLLGGIFL